MSAILSGLDLRNDELQRLFLFVPGKLKLAHILNLLSLLMDWEEVIMH